MRIVFRVDAGQIHHVAMGHAVRCLALANDLRTRGYEVLFLMREERSGNAFVAHQGFDVVLTESRDQIGQIARLHPDVAVFDVMDIGDAALGDLRAKGVKVVVIDDLGQKDLSADLVVNGNVVAGNHHYTGDVGSSLLGPSFAILGGDFDGKCNRRSSATLDSILVTMGGADPRGFTPIVVNSLVEKGIGKDILVVKGPAYGDRPIAKNMETGIKTQVRVQESVPDLSMLMVAADLVVSAGGRTAYELAATGTPSVLVPTAPHEVEVAKAMVAKGVAMAVSDADEGCLRRELVALVQSTSDLETRRRMADAGLRLIDGKGRSRVIDALVNLGRNREGFGWGND